ncbi:MAG: SRPBCC family protein [Trueperaceae bacterium]
MARFEKSIDVDVPVAEAYMLFSDFESFPSFMEGVQSVERLPGDRLRWHATIGGREEEWTARVTEQAPSSAIAWTSTSGARNEGRVTFDKLDRATTRVHMHIEYEPEGVIENVGAMLGVVNSRIAGDLKRFKELVEEGPRRGGQHGRGGSVDEVTASDLMDGGQRREARIQRDTGMRRG